MINLAPFTADDIPRLIEWIDSEEALLVWAGWSLPYPLTREAMEGLMREAERTGRLLFNARTTGGEAVGYIEVVLIDPAHGVARISRVLLAPHARGRGLGEAMVRAAATLAFERFAPHRLELSVFDVNARAIACYERVGFRREGMRREAFRVGDERWSEVMMSILAPEWTELRVRGGT